MAPPASGYERLASLGEDALVAAGTGDAELLGRLVDDWARTAAALPATPPAGAADALHRAAAAHAQLDVLLRAQRDRAGEDLARAGQGRRVAAGYGAGARVGLRAEHRA